MKAITGATLIDGNGGAPLSNAVALIEGSDIVNVGDAQSVPIPDGAEVIEAPGMTLMPGLIDTHDHLASFSYEIASRWGITEPRSTRHLRIASVLRQTLESGYTTVRDAGGLDAGFGLAVDEGLVPGPRLFDRAGFHHANRRHGRQGKSAWVTGRPKGKTQGCPGEWPTALRPCARKVREMVGAGASCHKDGDHRRREFSRRDWGPRTCCSNARSSRRWWMKRTREIAVSCAMRSEARAFVWQSRWAWTPSSTARISTKTLNCSR